METLDWMTCRCKIKTVLEGGICNSNLERWFLRKTGKNKLWKNPGSKDQPERDGHGESVVATHSCYVQSLTRDIHQSEGEQG